MTRPQYGKPETWPHREPDEPITTHTVEQRGRRYWVVSKHGWIGWERGPYWRRSSAEKVCRRAREEDR